MCIRDRLIPILISILSDSDNDEVTRIHALWSLESLSHFNEKAIFELLTEAPDNLKREAIRSLITFRPSLNELTSILQELIQNNNPQIRSQVIRTLEYYGQSNPESIQILVQASKPELEGNKMGGAYERKFERYLARRALENYPAGLSNFLNSPAASEAPVSNRLWALLALPEPEREQA